VAHIYPSVWQDGSGRRGDIVSKNNRDPSRGSHRTQLLRPYLLRARVNEGEEEGRGAQKMGYWIRLSRVYAG
jgi:hypothetical protein